MFNSAFDAVVPVICVTLAGLFALLAEAFREKGERMPIGGLAAIGLVGAGVASVLLWGRNATSFGVVTADNFSLFVNLVLVVIGLLTVVFSSQTLERDGLPAGEYLLAGPVRHRRHDADGAGHRPAADLPGPRDDVDRRLRADRAAPRPGQRHRGGVQVLPARRLRQLVLPLRHRLHLRRDRDHPPRAGRRGDCRPVDVGQPAAAAGRRPCSSSASPSRSRRCPSTCGHRTPTRAPRRWSPASCPPA